MKTVSINLTAYVTPYSTVSPQDLAEGKRVDELTFTKADMASAGWTIAGKATVTVELVDGKSLIDNKVAALKEEAKAIRAEATARVTRIEGQIQELLAISYEPEVSQ